MRLVLDDKNEGSSSHHMTAEWTGSGTLVFEDGDVRGAVGVSLRWSGRDDYGTINQEGDSAALYLLPEAIAVRVEQQQWHHEDMTVLSAQHYVTNDGGRTWRADPEFDERRFVGRRPVSRVGV